MDLPFPNVSSNTLRRLNNHNLLSATVELLQQAVQNIQQLQKKRIRIQRSIQPAQRLHHKSTHRGRPPFENPDPENLLNKYNALMELNQLISQFREDRHRHWSKNRASLDLVDFHKKIFFRQLRQMVNVIVLRIDGLNTYRGDFNERLLGCPYCEFRAQSTHLSSHICRKHGNNYYLYSCAVCGKDFPSHGLLVNHVRKQHVNNPRACHQGDTSPLKYSTAGALPLLHNEIQSQLGPSSSPELSLSLSP